MDDLFLRVHFPALQLSALHCVPFLHALHVPPPSPQFATELPGWHSPPPTHPRQHCPFQQRPELFLHGFAGLLGRLVEEQVPELVHLSEVQSLPSLQLLHCCPP